MTAFLPKQAVRPPQIPLLGKSLPKQVTKSFQVRQAVKLQLGQAGIVPGAQLGTGPPDFPGEQCCLSGRQCWFLERQPHTYPPKRLPQGSSPEDPNPKWDINLSSKPLTPAQSSVLTKGPNFVVSPKQAPNIEYITAIKAACTKLSQQDAEELRAEVKRVLRSSHPTKPNLTKAQSLALRELKMKRDCIVLTADKG